MTGSWQTSWQQRGAEITDTCRRMRVLLSFENFALFGGTETYMLTVAAELDRLGHEAAIYSPNHGAMAELAREQGIPVLSRRALPGACDLVIASDAATCHELAGRYPGTPQVFRATSDLYDVSLPPNLPGVTSVVVALSERLAWENALWGYERIRGELQRLGYRISGSMIRRVFKRAGSASPAGSTSWSRSGPR